MRVFLSAALSAALVLVSPLAAETPMPFPDFSAKRVGVPKSGSKRLTVQIDPAEQAAVLDRMARREPPEIVTPAPSPELNPDGSIRRDIGSYGWFWKRISPALSDSGPGRLFSAMDVITGIGEVPQPRLQHMQNIARTNGIDILRSTVGTRVSPALVLAVISVESAGKPDAVSHAGATGLMQLMPATAERFGVTDITSPSQNIGGGVAYLDWLMEEFDGDPILVLAGYNAGEGSLRKYKGVPPFVETRDYVPKVLAAFQVARGLCLTPPELVSDGCVFAGLN